MEMLPTELAGRWKNAAKVNNNGVPRREPNLTFKKLPQKAQRVPVREAIGNPEGPQLDTKATKNRLRIQT